MSSVQNTSIPLRLRSLWVQDTIRSSHEVKLLVGDGCYFLFLLFIIIVLFIILEVENYFWVPRLCMYRPIIK